MKKFVATIFLFVYFITSTGATVQLHYCMNKLVSWSLETKGKSVCNKCGMVKMKHKGCCHDENKIIKVDKDHKATFASFDFLKYSLPLHKNTSHSYEVLRISNLAVSYPKSNAPPVLSPVPVYLSNSVFRIWYPSLPDECHACIAPTSVLLCCKRIQLPSIRFRIYSNILKHAKWNHLFASLLVYWQYQRLQIARNRNCIYGILHRLTPLIRFR